MNILVTGANGFIGSNIVSKLSTNLKFNVFKGTRDTINLLSSNDVQKYIQDNNINSGVLSHPRKNHFFFFQKFFWLLKNGHKKMSNFGPGPSQRSKDLQKIVL